MKKLRTSIFIFLVLFGIQAFGQGEIDDEQKITFKHESAVLAKITSTGWSLGYSYGKRIDGYRNRLYTIEFAEIRHLKEQKEWNDDRTARYVYGKLNAFFALRAGMGMQKELFSKFDKGGIAIRFYYNLGASLGIMKPIYYDIRKFTSASPGFIEEIHSEKFNMQTRDIIAGRSSMFRGMDEMMFSPGGHLNFGFSFENSKKDESVRALEVGATIDAFARPIEIMATRPKDNFFISLYIGYRFGKAIRMLGSQG